ncbi:tyrosine-protein kinase BAZ1B-like [Olea europaea var. sylvestris]|uniref:tyrosine-protein kinase BAZ1B-like n=1 Tax=Olea europaea var. sylvestris TaxID=158386 RepID=UPI000C1CDD47|nr:tyrosine-protein kinase BAZ1B-like [Olea europaea var. sylvestris]
MWGFLMFLLFPVVCVYFIYKLFVDLLLSEVPDWKQVKVCDICGDAGREDLLAVCSRCSDGAEHTYCMQETLTKVPEGNWLCEECKVEEQMSNRRQGKIGKIDGNEKNNSFGQATSENINSFDVEGNRTKGCSNMKTCGKRPRDENEVSSVAKKPAIESIMTSPRNSSSNKTAALSRENSFKNLDRGRMQPINHSSSATLPVNDTLESARTALDPRIQTSRGYLIRYFFNFCHWLINIS